MKRIVLSGFCLSLSACSTAPVGILYTDINNSRSYRAATPAEVQTSNNDEAASGLSCNQGVLGLVAWGEGGYSEAVQHALKGQSSDKVLYDVKSDVETLNILGFVYQKLCTRVTGKIGTIARK